MVLFRTKQRENDQGSPHLLVFLSNLGHEDAEAGNPCEVVREVQPQSRDEKLRLAMRDAFHLLLGQLCIGS